MKFFVLQVMILSILGILNGNPIDISPEYGENYEGDILLTDEQKTELENPGRSGRTGTTNTNLRWPKVNGKVIVPYYIDNIYTATERNIILRAMTELEQKTCVDFVPWNGHRDYIHIVSGGGCSSYVGRIGGRQQLSLRRNGCLVHGIAMHEMIHALGYGHMHQHPDRDSKAYISWQNIATGMSVWFEKLDMRYYNNYGTSYDISSVMHYGPYAFSRNGYRTITAYNSADNRVMGQRSYLSSGDVTRIKNMYTC